MKLALAKDMKQMDERMMEDIASTQLMKQAAQAVYECICERFEKGKHILILCGSGNNGGDGYALAHLAKDTYQVEILALKKPATNDAMFFYELVKEEVRILSSFELQRYDLIVDGLFGTGLDRVITGEYVNLIQQVNDSCAYKLAIDIPSGVHADTGNILGTAIQADLVVSFQFAKRGLYVYPGYTYCKEIIVKDIGIKKEYQVLEHPMSVLDAKTVSNMLPKRLAHSHKGTYGKVLMIGGSASMHGAITMAADSALHSGIGTLTLFIPNDIREIVSMKLMEAMLINVPSVDGYFAKEAIPVLQESIASYDVVMIGCGMGRTPVGEKLLEVVLTSAKPCVIDADALYFLGNHLELLKRDAPVILTPHLKEFSYLSQYLMEEILKNPINCGETFIKGFPNVTLVLKDHRTLIFHQKQTYINIRGSNALAKGGSGDVLCGIITGLFAQGKENLNAACCGVFVHALSGEYGANMHSEYSLLPHELRDYFDHIFQELCHLSKKA